MPMTVAWLHLYGAAITGLLMADAAVGTPANLVLDAADIADAAARLIAERQEILKLAQAVVDQPEPDEEG